MMRGERPKPPTQYLDNLNNVVAYLDADNDWLEARLAEAERLLREARDCFPDEYYSRGTPAIVRGIEAFLAGQLVEVQKELGMYADQPSACQHDSEGKRGDVVRTDTERLDALEELVNNGDCPGIINDDNGHWAVTGFGVQNCVAGDEPQDVSTSFFVEASQWRKTIREAIDSYLDDNES